MRQAALPGEVQQAIQLSVTLGNLSNSDPTRNLLIVSEQAESNAAARAPLRAMQLSLVLIVLAPELDQSAKERVLNDLYKECRTLACATARRN